MMMMIGLNTLLPADQAAGQSPRETRPEGPARRVKREDAHGIGPEGQITPPFPADAEQTGLGWQRRNAAGFNNEGIKRFKGAPGS